LLIACIAIGPVHARFVSVDPVQANASTGEDFNRYHYANDNPYRFADPDGRQAKEMIKGGVNLIRALIKGPPKQAAPTPAAPKPTPGKAEAKAEPGNEVAAPSQPASTLVHANPRNLIPTEPRATLNGSQVNRMAKDMKQGGYDDRYPVDAARNAQGRLEIQDGHHRTDAAKRAGLDKIPVRVWGPSE
jgi:hypothetical protein